MKDLEVPDELVRWFSRHAAFDISFDCRYSEALKTTSCSRRAIWRGVLALQHPQLLDGGSFFFFGSPLVCLIVALHSWDAESVQMTPFL